MGEIFNFTCKKCRKKYKVSVGIGYMQPSVCEDTFKDIAAGKYGSEWKEACEQGGDSLAVTAEEAVYRCEKCGNCENKTDITLYAPDNASNKNRGHFIMRGDEGFHVYKQYIPVCSKCGGSMKEVEDYSELACPKCGTVNESGDMWLAD